MAFSRALFIDRPIFSDIYVVVGGMGLWVDSCRGWFWYTAWWLSVMTAKSAVMSLWILYGWS